MIDLYLLFFPGEFNRLLAAPAILILASTERRTSLEQEIGSLTDEVARMRPYEDGTDLDTLQAKQAELQTKRGELVELRRRQELYTELDQYQFQQTQSAFAQRGENTTPRNGTRIAGVVQPATANA